MDLSSSAVDKTVEARPGNARSRFRDVVCRQAADRLDDVALNDSLEPKPVRWSAQKCARTTGPGREFIGFNAGICRCAANRPKDCRAEVAFSTLLGARRGDARGSFNCVLAGGSRSLAKSPPMHAQGRWRRTSSPKVQTPRPKRRDGAGRLKSRRADPYGTDAARAVRQFDTFTRKRSEGFMRARLPQLRRLKATILAASPRKLLIPVKVKEAMHLSTPPPCPRAGRNLHSGVPFEALLDRSNGVD